MRIGDSSILGTRLTIIYFTPKLFSNILIPWRVSVQEQTKGLERWLSG